MCDSSWEGGTRQDVPEVPVCVYVCVCVGGSGHAARDETRRDETRASSYMRLCMGTERRCCVK